MRVFKRVLLDTNNLFRSSDPVRLFNCCEAFRALIFPFKYENVYIPHLPEALLFMVEAPINFILGIEEKHYEATKKRIKDGTYIIDLDNDNI
jgi:hypothetical protein